MWLVATILDSTAVEVGFHFILHDMRFFCYDILLASFLWIKGSNDSHIANRGAQYLCTVIW